MSRRYNYKNNDYNPYKPNGSRAPLVSPLNLDSHYTSLANNNTSDDDEDDQEGSYISTSEDEESSKLSPNSVGTFTDSSEGEGKENLKGLEAVRIAYLADKKNHLLKCMMLDLAGKRSQKQDIPIVKDSLVEFQEKFFKRRGIKPNIDDVIRLGNAIKKFSIQANRMYNWT